MHFRESLRQGGAGPCQFSGRMKPLAGYPGPVWCGGGRSGAADATRSPAARAIRTQKINMRRVGDVVEIGSARHVDDQAR
jgi:hypothetical protein